MVWANKDPKRQRITRNVHFHALLWRLLWLCRAVTLLPMCKQKGSYRVLDAVGAISHFWRYLGSSIPVPNGRIGRLAAGVNRFHLAWAADSSQLFNLCDEAGIESRVPMNHLPIFRVFRRHPRVEIGRSMALPAIWVGRSCLVVPSF